MNRALAGVCALWMLSACNIASVAEQPSAIPQNKCASDADCAVGSCDGRWCRATKGGFDTILFAVTPPADATSIAGFQFIRPVFNVPSGGGTLDLPLDLVAKVSGGVTLLGRKCTPKFFDAMGHISATANDDSIPAFVSVMPSSGALGLFSSPATAKAVLSNGASWTFTISVPPGKYDIYVQPPEQPDADCIVPPQLLRGQSISTTVILNIALPEPQTFDLHVTWPLADGALDRWSVDMLDPIVGRAISNSAPLAANASGTDYVASLSYLPVVGETAQADELVRLSPPDDITAPTLLFARGGLGLFSAASGTVSEFISLPTPVHIAGAVTANSTPTPVAATVTLVATKITGIAPGVLASFVRTVPVSADGTFDLDVLPGTYRVAAVPTGTANPTDVGFAEATTEWVVGSAPSVQAGKVIELSQTLDVHGVAFDPSGTVKMTGAQVQAAASPASITTDVLHQTLGETVNVPRATSTTVDSGGAFKLRVDSGTYDFSVRPRSSSGFGWLVIPGVKVGTTPQTIAGEGLDSLTLPLPLVYHGSVTVPGSSAGMPTQIPGALISAYIYMKGGAYTADSAQADSVLQIAETLSNDSGDFDLLIPASLNTPPLN